ncbi:MAG: TonB-dependent receptor [bacterium]
MILLNVQTRTPLLALLMLLGVARPGLAQDYGVTTTENSTVLPVAEAASEVDRESMDERLPRSSPDALRYEPGVFVQQTAHGQGSAYIRGLTGQQTVMLFDDVRMNNSLYRQGPNQYFFTIDSLTLDRIEVIRGSASTRFGSDALGGALRAYSIEPVVGDDRRLSGRAIGRVATADRTRALRAESQVSRDAWAIRAGWGFRLVDELESGGPIYNPQDGELPQVPRFRQDGRTQRGTGFDEVAGDVVAVWQPSENQRLKLAWFDYRQFDVPRTDNCPPPYAPFNECLLYEEQFRDVAYLRWDTRLGALAHNAYAVVSLQRQHERRRQIRPFALADEVGRDEVLTLGLSWSATTRRWEPSDWLNFDVLWGVDAYADTVESKGWQVFSTIDLVRERSRGQYIDGSGYQWGGVFADARFTVARTVRLTAGARQSFVAAQSPGDVTSGTESIDRSWTPAVGHVGVEWWATPWISLVLNVDQGFRAPNLDDLTSRQRTGPGYQFENAALTPETSLTTEAGAVVRTSTVQFDGWLYRMTLANAIARQPRNTEECPPATPACAGSWSRFRLVNLPGESEITGAEAGAKWQMTKTLETRASVSYAVGEGPSPEEGRSQERVPLSRIPPLNGTVELTWRFAPGAYAGASMRWARPQTRLALQDVSDERIPRGGTPGFAVFDLRAGLRVAEHMAVNAVFENVTDEAYRYHGSSVNGPARSLSWQLEVGF